MERVFNDTLKSRLREHATSAIGAWMRTHPTGRFVIKVSGSLGNQLFQYAAGLRLSEINGAPVVYDRSSYDVYKRYRESSANLCAAMAWARDSQRGPVTVSSMFMRIFWSGYRRSIIDGDSAKFEKAGFLRSQTYESGFRDEGIVRAASDSVRRHFDFSNCVRSPTQRHALDSINRCQSVALILIRSDWKRQDRGSEWSGPWPSVGSVERYRVALAGIKTRVKDAKPFLFTDDREWAATVLPETRTMTAIENFSIESLESLALAASCRHHIIPQTAFSWWAAWLSANPGGTVYYIKSAVDDSPAHITGRPESWIVA